jgi:hypothetical protein
MVGTSENSTCYFLNTRSLKIEEKKKQITRYTSAVEV